MTPAAHDVHDVIDGLGLLICGLDRRGAIRVFNAPCERLTGISRGDASGRSWLDIFAPGERGDHVVAMWDQAREDAPAGPYEVLFQNSRSIRWHFCRWDRAGIPGVALWAVGIDLTQDRKALVRVRELERMVALGNLVSGLTHELRNPLNGALLQLALAERSLGRCRDEAVAPAAAAIAQASVEIRRISTLLDDFLVFVRPQPVHLECSDVRTLAARAVERGRPKAVASGVSVALEPSREALAAVDGSRVETAVFQLLANAIDAASVSTDHEVRVRVGALGNAVAIEVEDHGAGLPSDAPIFEPFFTTKQGGTGLGLAIVQRVAADHGGRILHEQRSGATVFRLELPIAGGVAG
jgi:signal transduction histidine kinase